MPVTTLQVSLERYHSTEVHSRDFISLGSVIFLFFIQGHFTEINFIEYEDKLGEVRAWCMSNCLGEVKFQHRNTFCWISFYDRTEAMRFKLIFC